MAEQSQVEPRLVVFSTLFPHPGQPTAGLFIRERMFRVGQKHALVVVAPVPWFPLQGLIRLFCPHYRPPAPFHEVQDGFDVYHPRFLAIPGLFRTLDGLSMALFSRGILGNLKKSFRFNLIDAHFAYPDGYAAILLGRWFRVPVTITLRGTEVPLSRTSRCRHMMWAIARASRVFAVADALRRHVINLGADPENIRVVGNGVDTEKFQPMSKSQVRQSMGIAKEAPVLVTVGGLVERKGFHRVIKVLPKLKERYPDILYLVVGGASAEGDCGEHLRQMVRHLGLSENVQFLGVIPPAELKQPLSAADVFVLPTRNEGWANVILEAMACGVPVVATNVGGNAEVISSSELGILVPFGDGEALTQAIGEALSREWDHEVIVQYARTNSWGNRVDQLVLTFNATVRGYTS